MNGYLGEFEIEVKDNDSAFLAMQFVSLYGYIDGAHHKQWVLDQVARILLGTKVIFKEARWDNGHTELRPTTGEPSPDYLEWVGTEVDNEDVIGIAP